MDWASGHWPGIVHVCLDACVLFRVRGGALGQGNRHHGHRLQGPPGPLCPPQRGHMARHPLTDPDTIGRQFTQQPSSLTPRWWIHLLAWGRRNEITSSVISVLFVFSEDWVIRWPLEIIKNMANSTLLYSILLSSLITPPSHTVSFITVLYCTVLYCTPLYSILLPSLLTPTQPQFIFYYCTVLILPYSSLLYSTLL